MLPCTLQPIGWLLLLMLLPCVTYRLTPPHVAMHLATYRLASPPHVAMHLVTIGWLLLLMLLPCVTYRLTPPPCCHFE